MADNIIQFSSVATFNAVTNKARIKELSTDINFIQTGSGTPSSENIRPILGWDTVNIHRHVLPSGYKEVDNVTTESVVNVDISDIFQTFNRNDIVFAVTFKALTYYKYGAIFQAYTAEAANCTRLIFNSSITSFFVNNNNRASAPTSVTIPSGVYSTVVVKKGTCIINGVSRSITTTAGSANTQTSFKLGRDGAKVSYKQIDVYAEANGETTPYVSLVPCINPQGIAGFYDIINSRFHTTADSSKISAEGVPVDNILRIGDTILAVNIPSEIGTVYGGALGVTKGILTITKQNIASYNGETLNGEWVSDRDVYAEGVTPTTGAQVVHDLVPPAVYELSPTTVPVSIGQNTIGSETGNIALTWTEDGAIKLNGTDMTDCFVPRGIKVRYEKVLGKNGGTFLSGDREEDILAWKAIVTLTCMPLDEAQQAKVLSKVMVDDPTLYYFDPRMNAYRTIHYMGSIAETVYRGKGSNQVDYWTGIVITAEEK